MYPEEDALELINACHTVWQSIIFIEANALESIIACPTNISYEDPYIS